MMLKHNYSLELINIVKYTNDYAKYKHKSGTKPAAPEGERYYKLSQIKAEFSATNGTQFDTFSANSLLKLNSFAFALKVGSSLVYRIGALWILGLVFALGFN